MTAFPVVLRNSYPPEAAAKTAVHRLKARLRVIVAGHLGATASSEKELKAELEDSLAFTS